MAYGWSPEQMARVNERRASRGQKLLDPGKIGPRYAERYNEEQTRRKKKYEEEDVEPEPEMSPLDRYLADIRMRKAQRGRKILTPQSKATLRTIA